MFTGSKCSKTLHLVVKTKSLVLAGNERGPIWADKAIGGDQAQQQTHVNPARAHTEGNHLHE